MESEMNSDEMSFLEKIQSRQTVEYQSASESERDEESTSGEEAKVKGKHNEGKKCDEQTKDEEFEGEKHPEGDQEDDEIDKERARHHDDYYDGDENDLENNSSLSGSNQTKFNDYAFLSDDKCTMKGDYASYALREALDKRHRMYISHDWVLKMSGIYDASLTFEPCYAFMLLYQQEDIDTKDKGKLVHDGFVVMWEKDGRCKELLLNFDRDDERSLWKNIEYELYGSVTTEDLHKYESAVFSFCRSKAAGTSISAISGSNSNSVSSSNGDTSGNGVLPVDFFETISREMNARAKAMQPYTVQNTFLGPCTYEVIPITPPFKPNKSITWHLLNFSNDEINRLAKEVDVDKLKQDLLYGFTVYRGYINNFKQTGVQAVLAPFKLKFKGSEEDKSLDHQYGGRDVILLNIWQTRCSTPRLDLIIYLDWLENDNGFVQLSGQRVNHFLKYRYCDPMDEYNVKEVFEKYHKYLKCTRRFYDGKLPPNVKDSWKEFEKVKQMSDAAQCTYYLNKRALVEKEFAEYGLDIIDPNARDKFEKFQCEQREKLNNGADSLYGNQDSTNPDDTLVSQKIHNPTITTNAKSTAKTKIVKSRIAKAKETPRNKGKGRMSDSEVSESEKENSQPNSNRGRKRARESVDFKQRFTSSPSSRSSGKPPSKVSHKRKSSGVISDLTEESEKESVPQGDRAKRLANRNARQDDFFLSVPAVETTPTNTNDSQKSRGTNGSQKTRGKKGKFISPAVTIGLESTQPPLPPQPPAFNTDVLVEHLMTRLEAQISEAISVKSTEIFNQRLGIAEMCNLNNEGLRERSQPVQAPAFSTPSASVQLPPASVRNSTSTASSNPYPRNENDDSCGIELSTSTGYKQVLSSNGRTYHITFNPTFNPTFNFN